MASYLQIENISKSYGPKVLFEHIGFNINEGDKIALIAPNGTGKTSLLRILAGHDSSDSGGRITFLKDIRIAFLEQDYAFDPSKPILTQILDSSEPFTKGLDADGLFAYELRIKQILSSFGMPDHGKLMSTLSGGEVKRVAITQMLATGADFFIMDEPTNHLDVDAIEFLENWFAHARCTLLMVTHDRYFLDRVCNTVLELDHGDVYTYRGDYANYLEKRQERIDNYNAETDKVRNILRRELEWMRSTPCARSGKAKYRKDAFYELKDRSEQVYKTTKVDMSEVGGASRLGSKIIDCKHVSFYYGGVCYLKDFSYNFARGEKVGIVGRNGVGKTTFLNLLTGGDHGDGVLSGIIERGESLQIGYYRQEGMKFDEGQTVMETVPDLHLLNQFLFPHDMLNNKVSMLSGGERRRLYLLTILMKKPNLLILDEPTNDLDIVTLDILEEYLLEFKGSLIIVSHDRHFLDRITDHLLVLCGDGVVKDFIGKFSEYRAWIKDYEAGQKAAAKASSSAKKTAGAGTSGQTSDSVNVSSTRRDASAAPAKRRLSYKEKREMKQLEADIEALNTEKAGLQEQMNSGTLAYDALQAASARYAEVSSSLDEKEFRLLELSEIA